MPQLDEPIRIVPYDPAWPSRFAAEATALETAIGNYASGGVHHVGSTAVPGLDAKPIIDILVGVDGLAASRAAFDRLRSDPAVADEYAVLKHDLAERFADDREAYTEAKGEFIHRVLANAQTLAPQRIAEPRRQHRPALHLINVGLHLQSLFRVSDRPAVRGPDVARPHLQEGRPQ